MLDILIQNALIVDGSGRPAYPADVGVSGDRIAVIGRSLEQQALRVIDARGLCCSPGFIDAHSHSDGTLYIAPQAESRIYQGVTTEVVGNCGSSQAPLIGASLAEAQSWMRHLELGPEAITWTDMAGYIERLKALRPAVNIIPLVGHNTIREAVLGCDDVQPSPEQQAEMERLVEEAMLQGARGLSSGLFYPPGCYAATREVIGLARAAAKHGGIYTSHIRSESSGLFEAVDEAILIGREAETRVQISHLKLEGYRNFAGVERLLEKIETADAVCPVGADQYPYPACSTDLAATLPTWAQAGGGKAVARRLNDPETRRRLRLERETDREAWDARIGVRGWDEVLVCMCPHKPEYSGMTIAEIARTEKQDPLETLFDLIAGSEAAASGVFFDQLEENVQAILKDPRIAVGSDGSALAPTGLLGKTVVHPRSYGTFPRLLGRYVRELKILSLEQAVHKMTGVPAMQFGLKDRGVLRPGALADIVLFDPLTVEDRATYTRPHQFPAGIPYVIINGALVIDQGICTGLRPGCIL